MGSIKNILQWMLAIGLCLGGAQAEPIRVMLLSGQNNHDWKKTSPLLKNIFEKAGNVELSVTERPDLLVAEDFQNIDVIVSNWNTVPKNSKVKEWPAPLKKAYVEFVKNGGGHLCVHAGSSSFYDWKEYHEISLMTWKHKRTTHGRQHVFPIRVDDEAHPVCKGWNPGQIRGELWRNIEVHPKAKVLASSFSAEHDGGSETWEPCVFVGQFGKGRCFATSLGHDVRSLSQPKVEEIFIRALQWVSHKR
ncbi:ThuA domain-containing protein [Verrucomicrobiaceae bacterium N1E253]|uniref:ThuA domain-containing protein n=1 Tax=Oceaniferula marina TaxID=2748318 RepID=A0A851GRI0_9BACT|nr:ThuA domain-containing protein [Oceaniferula marina]NWK57380.1 ThuA domain-containing protein [Oceaniferula marina]